MADIPEFAIAKLELQPGDVLVLKFPEKLSREQMDNVRQAFSGAFSGFKAMILDGGADIAVLSAKEIEQRMVATAA